MDKHTHCQKAIHDKESLKDFIAEHYPDSMEDMEFATPCEAMIHALYCMAVCNDSSPVIMAPLHVEAPAAAHEDNWHKAIASKNWKWILAMRLDDEVRDAHMDIEAMSAAKAAGKAEIAEAMHMMAKTRVENAAAINKLYLSTPYTSGTADEIKRWDAQHAAILKRHATNVSRVS